MNDVLNRVASALEQRFMLVLLLPVLIFVSAFVVLMIATAGSWRDAVNGWGTLPGSLQFVFILGYLSTIWLLAGFLDSQLRNITQLFEGYQLALLCNHTAERAVAWHRKRRRELRQTGNEDDATKQESSQTPYSENLFVLYPPVRVIQPTRLGNVLRSAEEYSKTSYGANYLLIWPRLNHLCSERFVQDYEVSRANVDFLLVVSTLSALFALLGGLAILVLNGTILAFIAVVLGGFLLSHLAYASAVDAAVEYGEQIRASVDLFRLDLLRQLRYPEPADAKRERAMWQDFTDMLKSGEPRQFKYEPVPKPPDPGPA
jgi:hypothetical protein